VTDDYKRYSGYDTFSDRSERLSEMVQKNNALLEKLGANGLISPGCDENDGADDDDDFGYDDYDSQCVDCDYDVNRCICPDDDEPDYLGAIHAVVGGKSS
jgi:hypothetical protein